MASQFELELTVQPTNEQGEVVETTGDPLTYGAVFSVDASSTLSEGSGSFSVPRSSNLHTNDDGDPDALRGEFTYLVSDSDSVIINLQNLESEPDEDAWESYRGGGFSLTLAIDQANGSLHQGGYSIIFDDGSNEIGEWTSQDIRLEPLSQVSE